jgi:hypothetical protein
VRAMTDVSLSDHVSTREFADGAAFIEVRGVTRV